ncbi:MAG: tetratricopeptide repeat protein [candidate division KSB1 bacterium]|jgi:tetratricopeptide (TPR) repeat protein|nr:tetratricopeptide repeat protein [candidate division KSB1 bacterium]
MMAFSNRVKRAALLLLIILAGCSSVREADTLYKTGDYNAVIAECERILSADSTNANAHFLMGRSLQQIGKIEDALHHLEQAQQLKPTDREFTDALINVTLAFSDSLTARDNKYKALQQLKTAVQLDSTSEKARWKLARFYERENMLENALVHMNKLNAAEHIQRINTRIASADELVQDGIIDIRKYAYQSANKKFTEAVEINSDNKDARYYQTLSNGILLYNAGDKSSLWDAIEAFGKAMSLRWNSGEPHFYMALAYEKKDRREFDNAIAEYKLAIEKEPDGYFVPQSRKKIKELTKLKKRLEDFWGK